MTRLLLVIASIALAFGAGAVAATSLSVTQTRLPAQGSATVSGACVDTATIAYTYADSTGATTAASSGDAASIESLVVTRTSGSSTCVGTNAAIRFDNTTGTAPVLALGGANPAFAGDASAGTWTFAFDTTSPNNAILDWSTGGGITVTVY